MEIEPNNLNEDLIDNPNSLLLINDNVKYINNENDNNSNLKTAIFDIVFSSFPISISFLFVILIETINIFYIGRLDNIELISAIGLGTTFNNLIGLSIIYGLVGGIDTLCSQAFGANKYNLIGTYTSICRFFIFSFCLLVYLPLALNSSKILSLLSSNENLIMYTSEFTKYMIPGVFIMGQKEVINRYLQSMLIFKPQMIISLISFIIHIFLGYFYILYMNMGIKGAGLAFSSTQLINLIILYVYFLLTEGINKETKVFYNKNTFKVNYILYFIKYSISAGVLGLIESFAFEILIILSSFLGVIQMSATICLFNFSTINFFFTLGIGNATGSYVGNSIGRKDEKQCKTYIKAGLTCTLIYTIAFLIVIIKYRVEILHLYTKNIEIEYYFLEIIPYYCFYLSFDNLSIVVSGIVKGIGKQYQALKIILLIIYCFGLPIQIILTFVFKQEILGLWRGQLVTVLSLFFGICYLLKTIDLNKEIDDQHRVMSEYKEIDSYKSNI